MGKQMVMGLCGVLILLFHNTIPPVILNQLEMQKSLDTSGNLFSSSPVYAADEKGERSPYGGAKGGEYGEKKPVLTRDEAHKILKEYFSKREVRIGEVKEKELYFEAEILGKNNRLIDKVIVDKRTGRIRSVF
jgi:hypothetical protein